MAVILFAPQIFSDKSSTTRHRFPLSFICCRNIPLPLRKGGEGDVAGNGLQNILCETLCPPW